MFPDALELKICVARKVASKSSAMKSTGRKTVKVERTSAPLKKTARAVKQAAPVDKVAPTLRVPTYEEIAKRSFELFLARGGDQGFGSAEQDWLQAERELSRA
jgi:hypothetical protein